MTVGPGKYDDACAKAADEVGLGDAGGCVMLIVVGGKHGSGFSCQADLATSLLLPDILEDVAQQMRRDAAGLKQ
jgi:hypothetical protein